MIIQDPDLELVCRQDPGSRVYDMDTRSLILYLLLLLDNDDVGDLLRLLIPEDI